MRTIDKITDHVLKKMKPRKQWSWQDWWMEFVQDGPVPGEKTLRYKTFIAKRLIIKDRINRQLAKDHLAVRLKCKYGKGLYLEDKNHIAKTSIKERSKRFANLFKTTIVVLDEISCAHDLPDEDRKLLLRFTGAFELNQSALIGTFTRMRSLTAAQKKEILSILGVKL